MNIRRIPIALVILVGVCAALAYVVGSIQPFAPGAKFSNVPPPAAMAATQVAPRATHSFTRAAQAVASPVRSDTPTRVATAPPSRASSSTSTRIAKVAASRVPSETSTRVATQVPSPAPSNTPTRLATVTASRTPSDTPTRDATETPSPVPSDTPTQTRSVVASSIPSKAPTRFAQVVLSPAPPDTPTLVAPPTPSAAPTNTPVRVAQAVSPTARVNTATRIPTQSVQVTRIAQATDPPTQTAVPDATSETPPAQQTENAAATMTSAPAQETLNAISTRAFATPVPKGTDPERAINNSTNFLLIGTDSRTTDPTWVPNTDVVMVLFLDTANQRAALLSLPRDLVVAIPGHQAFRINSAYRHGWGTGGVEGGVDVLKQILRDDFEIRIDHWALIDFDGLSRLIDTLGGIEVNVPCALSDTIDDQPFTIPAGLVQMDYLTAKRYVQSRYTTSDTSRNHRQQRVVWAMAKKALQMNAPDRLPLLYETLRENVATDMNLFNMIGLVPAVYQLDLQSHPERMRARVLEAPAVYPWVSTTGAWLYMPNYDLIQQELDEIFEAPQVALDEPTRAECPALIATPQATDAPTVSPSAQPSPSDQTTATPSLEVTPTEVPTTGPTDAPAQAPTEMPTAEPAQAPTEMPTAEPTQAPAEMPTPEPTQAPAEPPTETPEGEATLKSFANLSPAW